MLIHAGQPLRQRQSLKVRGSRLPVSELAHAVNVK